MYKDPAKRKSYGKKYWPLHKEKMLQQTHLKRLEKKEFIFDLLGRKCRRCGFNDSRALQIDHLLGHGKKERTGLTSYDKYVKNIYLLALSSPKELNEKYQILCANCNWIKRFENREHN